MKKILILTIVLLTGVYAYSTTFPVIEPFMDSDIDNTWEQFWGNSATLESVLASGEPCGDSPKGDGYIGKSTCTTTGAGSSGHVTGEFEDNDYTLQAYIYTDVVNAETGLESYLYQQLIFYREGDPISSTGYGRFLAHFNTFPLATTPPPPRLRLQISNPTFAYTQNWVETDFTAPTSSSWHKMKIEISGTTAVCYFDDVALPGTVDWTAEAATRNKGKFGFGQYMNAAGTRSLYVDMFKAYKGAEPPDPEPTPTPEPPTAAQNWMYFE